MLHHGGGYSYNTTQQYPEPFSSHGFATLELTQAKVFMNATHGWDHGKDYSVPVQGGCLGRTNCTNRIVSSPVTVEQGKKAVMNFLISR